jgi:chromosome segregation ATPase
MNHGVGERQESSAEVRWWNSDPPLGEIAEQLKRALADRQALESRLADVSRENRRLCLRYDQAKSEFTKEQERLTSEIEDLRWQVAEGRKLLQYKSGAGRQVAELAARERLLKDECERKVQALQVELNRERHQLNKERNHYAKHIEKMELDRSSCICSSVRSHVEQNNVRVSAVLPESWRTATASK